MDEQGSALVLWLLLACDPHGALPLPLAAAVSAAPSRIRWPSGWPHCTRLTPPSRPVPSRRRQAQRQAAADQDGAGGEFLPLVHGGELAVCVWCWWGAPPRTTHTPCTQQHHGTAAPCSPSSSISRCCCCSIIVAWRVSAPLQYAYLQYACACACVCVPQVPVVPEPGEEEDYEEEELERLETEMSEDFEVAEMIKCVGQSVG